MILIIKTESDLLSKYNDLGDVISRLSSYQTIIQGDVEAVFDTASDIDDENTKMRFLGERYLELVEKLKLAGFIK